MLYCIYLTVGDGIMNSAIKNIRPVTAADMPNIRAVYDSAKRFMDSIGDQNQWPVGYPYDDILAEDIAQGNLFAVCGNDGIPHGVFALIRGVDRTYINIYDGAWLSEREYVALHRVASDGKTRGVMRAAVAFAQAEHPDCDIRIDTHEDNSKMHSVLTALGFKKCGIIIIDTGAPRVAYQLETDKITQC